MIKIIATDLDGTLLQNGAQSVSERAIHQINELNKKGIVFAAASGRQYPNLFRLFGKASENMGFICENGALVMYQGHVISKSSMDRTLALNLIEDIYNRKGCEVLISGEATSYVKPKTESYLYRMTSIVKNNVTVVDDFASIPEDIIKVSAYEKTGIVNGSASYFTKKWQDHAKCTVSGIGWIDFVNPDVNKGTALKSLATYLKIPHDKTMAFGDNYNDLEMLDFVKYGFVMDNAVEDIRSRYVYHTPLVEQTLEEVLSGITPAILKEKERAY
ncbi:MAG: HAD family hydrolase [Lachnospiraceae bacterium]|nr:HAD family hydrolase [Lachnospiraceae bacterium]